MPSTRPNQTQNDRNSLGFKNTKSEFLYPDRENRFTIFLYIIFFDLVRFVAGPVILGDIQGGGKGL